MKDCLLLRYIQGDTTEVETQKVFDWIESDPKNRARYRALRRAWEVSLWQVRPAVARSTRGVGRWITRVAAAVVLVGLSVGGTLLWRVAPVEPIASSLQRVVVPAGQRAELTLADGTHVWLNSNSTLLFPDHFSADNRTVRLLGEAYFDVTHNPERPFVVQTDRYDIRVLGTEFNVCAYSGLKPVFEAALVQGEIELYDKIGSRQLTLNPDQRAVWVNGGLGVDSIASDDYFEWREGIITINHESLPQIFERLERYYNVKFDVQNDRLATEYLSGKFRATEGLEHMVKVLQIKAGFRYRIDQDRIYIR